jgi:hypothetical protein
MIEAVSAIARKVNDVSNFGSTNCLIYPIEPFMRLNNVSRMSKFSFIIPSIANSIFIMSSPEMVSV